MVDYDITVFATFDAWISLITLSVLEIILGVDNIIFISIVASKLPKPDQPRARFIGLSLALIIRVILLLFIGWIIGLTKPLFSLPIENIFNSLGIKNAAEAAAISGRDLILILGGFFLLAKSTLEIHSKVYGEGHERTAKPKSAFGAVIFQIALIDFVFSFDSVLTAVGLTDHIMVMIFAVVISMIVMMLFSAKISTFIEKYPTLQILALSFLIMIGFTLVIEGFDVHISKAFVYVAVAFSLTVEALNIRFRKRLESSKRIA
ncbi:MAG: TerC family protein [Chitinophagales bacterium]|nr:TerC family protein [Chitinophagales bacterium]